MEMPLTARIVVHVASSICAVECRATKNPQKILPRNPLVHISPQLISSYFPLLPEESQVSNTHVAVKTVYVKYDIMDHTCFLHHGSPLAIVSLVLGLT